MQVSATAQIDGVDCARLTRTIIIPGYRIPCRCVLAPGMWVAGTLASDYDYVACDPLQNHERRHAGGECQIYGP